jgi:WD40 repeat protein
MTGDEATAIIDRILIAAERPKLNDLQAATIERIWVGETSKSIAEGLGYHLDYINQVAAKLWRVLSVCLQEPVTRKNIKTVLLRYDAQIADRSILTSVSDRNESVVVAREYTDDISQFYGRESELQLISQWATIERCRTIGMFGLGGIGKTACSIKLSQLLASNFEIAIWRSLRQAPTLDCLLQDILPILNDGQTADMSIENLLDRLQQCRCLLLLDNIESILEGGSDRSGDYLPGYENYGRLLESICDRSHQSCLIISGREQPQVFVARSGDNLPVRSMQLGGLPFADAYQILVDKGSVFTTSQSQILIDRLGGNPLALKIVASNIQNLFNNDVTAFLAQGYTVFGSLWQLLDRQFERLSPLQQQIMYWLAIVRAGITPVQLQAKIFPTVTLRQVLDALLVLRDRAAIETSDTGLTQQPVVMEYTIERFIDRIKQEIITGNFDLFDTHAAIEATAPEYVRHTQIQLILHPIAQKVLQSFGGIEPTRLHLRQLIAELRDRHVNVRESYSAGNLLNLLCYLKIDLQGWDFSQLTLRQAYLAEVQLRNTNFNATDFIDPVFAETFGAVISVAYSPDGRLLATGSSNGEIKIWSADDYQEILCCRGHQAWVMSLSFSPDGRSLASASDDHLVKIWDLPTGNCLNTYTEHTDSVNAVKFHPNGRTIASGGQDATIRFWDLSATVPLIGVAGLGYEAEILPSPPTPLPSLGEGSQSRRIWRGEGYHPSIQQRSLIKTLVGHEGGRVWSIDFSPDGELLVSGSEDRTIRIWDAATGACLAVWLAHEHWVRSVVFSPDGKRIASSSFDRTIKIWDARTYECLQTFHGHQQRVVALAFSLDNLHLISGSNDRTVKLWDLATSRCLKTFFGHGDGIWAVAYHPHHDRIASGARDYTTKIWDLQTGVCTKTLTGYANAVYAVAASPDGAYLASAHEDRTVKIWQISSGEIVSILRGHLSNVMSVAFSPNDEFLVTGSADESIKLWQRRTGKLLQTFKVHKSWVWVVAFSPDSRYFASGSYDRTLKVWDVSTGECIYTLVGHTSSIAAVDFSPDGRFLASGSHDNTVRIWNLATGNCDRVLTHHDNSIWTVKFSPDGKYLLSGSFDLTIARFCTDTWVCLSTYLGHQNFVKAIQFTPDGRHMLSAGFSGEIKLWDVESGECLHTLSDGVETIFSVDVAMVRLPDAADPRLLAFSGSLDTTIKVWDLHSYECLSTWKPPRPYEGMSIDNITGINESQVASLRALGAG